MNYSNLHTTHSNEYQLKWCWYIIRFMFALVTVFCMRSISFAITIDDIPPEVRQQPSPPNLMIVVDDSDSMFGETLNKNLSENTLVMPTPPVGYGGKQIGAGGTFSVATKTAWRYQWSGEGRTTGTVYNNLYYNPAKTYLPWDTMAESIPGSISATSLQVKSHPKYDDSKIDLNAEFYSFGTNKSIKNAHYYVWSKSAQKPYLINLVYADGVGQINYFRIDNTIQNSSSIASNSVVVVATSTVPSDVKSGRSYDQEIKNFANWYTYNRSRWHISVNSISRMLPNMSGIQVGIWSINGGPTKVRIPVKKIKVFNNAPPYNIIDETAELLNPLMQRQFGGGNTPLRKALNDIGKYYSGSLDGFGVAKETTYSQGTPLDQSAGGACQKNFVMIFTDGYYNDTENKDFDIKPHPDSSSTRVLNPAFDGNAYNNVAIGNCDTAIVDNYSGFDPYSDGVADISNTLGDIAMYYYKTDLSTVSDDVASSPSDPATHQHMVTYTVGMGLSGTKNYPAATDPTDWPSPYTGFSVPEKIDDLWHAAVNGRGSYFSASNPEELQNAFSNIASSIMSAVSSAASVSVNGAQVSDTLVFYQPVFLGNAWVGDLKAKSFPIVSGAADQTANPNRVVWSASEELSERAYTDRKIFTHNNTSSSNPGIPFRYDSGITATQKLALDTVELNARKKLDYIRGDHSNEKRNGGIYRNRTFEGANSKIGDIIHSTPFYDNGVIYVGANDGMLHAFRATDGFELFGYIPSLVFSNLKLLTEPDYGSNLHKFFVDSSPSVKKIVTGATSYRLLVGGLGYGGKGIYCLNVTNAISVAGTDESTSAGAVVKWEFPKVGSLTFSEDSNDMGYSYSKPYIVKTYNPDHPYVVIFGNGYNSQSGNAVLFIVDALTGERIKKIDVGNGPDNGLSTPSIVDVNGDGTADYVYAGDLKGNLWKFNIKSADPDSSIGTGLWGASSGGAWRSAYGTNPLFKAMYNSVEQPITGKPDVMLPCKTGLKGLMVVFGTGSFLSNNDRIDVSKQTVYGIWDYGDDSDASENVGTFSSHLASNSLSNTVLSGVSLLQQTLATEAVPGTLSGREIRVLSNNQPDWTTANDAVASQNPNPSVHAGWFLDLESTGEKLVNDIVLNGGAAIFASTIPSVASPCSAGGQSWLYEISACTGGRLKFGHFDINKDRQLNDSDLVSVPDSANPGQFLKISPSALYSGSLMYTPVIVDDPNSNMEAKATAVGNATIELIREQRAKKGIYYWRSF